MNRTLNTPILLLTISAVVLSAMVFFTFNAPEAQAAGDTVRQGRWIMSVARLDGNTDLLYVLDLKERKITIYGPDERGKRIGKATTLDLKRLFAAK
jgi:hypothetical protein